MGLELYGIPTCSTCRKARQWLEQAGIPYAFINTKEYPPRLSQIEQWVAQLGSMALRNTSGQSYRALSTDRKNWDDAHWITAFSQDAMLLKRPLFMRDGVAIAVGFRTNTLPQIVRQE